MVNVLLYLTSVLIWGTTWFAIKFQLGDVPIEWSLIYRFALASAALFAICVATGRPLRFSRREHGMFLALGFFLFSSNYYFSYLAVGMLTSGLVAVMFSTLSIMNIMNSAVFLKRPFDPMVLLAAVVGFGGIAMIFWPEIELQEWSGTETFVSVGTVLLAAYLASLGNTVAGTEKVKALPLIPLNAWGMLYGTILLTILALVSGIPPAYDTSLAYNSALIYLAIFGTVIAFTAYLALISRIGSDRAGYIAIGWPVVALVISTLFEDYTWTIPALAGVVMVTAGNLLIMVRRKTPASA